ncbi:baseplate J/gp47 family protein [Anaeroselena agilis]|uniref:Baseplate J/gp47 family protein n=1 Tax=Anaeroselena agilis TaxID=3063788 RepID=A0ABU3NYE9_9FIRM|nr:baseplate J/gp47 family protein [Selenomonadales bacterium 4137-cl]
MAKLNLPDIEFAAKDSATIEAEIIVEFTAETNESLADGDPRKKMLQAEVPIIVGQRAYIDRSAKMNLLAYAEGDFLDHLGALVDCPRTQATAATTTERFSLSAARPSSVTIAKGKRVAAGDGVFFATMAEGIIPAGSLYVDVKVQCTTAGTAGNDYAADTLTTLADPIPYIASVANLTKSEGGTDREEDDPYRERIHEAPESFSVAGPEGAYIFWAKTASSSIIDVAVDSLSPGCITIYPLLNDGELPGAELLASVLAICSADDVRPLTDNVSADAPTRVTYNIDVTYYIDKANESTAASIQEAVNAAVAAYQVWQRTKLGRGIDPSELSHRMKKAGASRVVVVAPAYAALTKSQVAKEDTVTINYGGIE